MPSAPLLNHHPQPNQRPADDLSNRLHHHLGGRLDAGRNQIEQVKLPGEQRLREAVGLRRIKRGEMRMQGGQQLSRAGQPVMAGQTILLASAPGQAWSRLATKFAAVRPAWPGATARRREWGGEEIGRLEIGRLEIGDWEIFLDLPVLR